jgi:hypothetical protein
MKIKQTVEAKFNDFYIGWSGIQFTDVSGNEIKIEITDSQVLELAKALNAKAESINEARAEKESEVE